MGCLRLGPIVNWFLCAAKLKFYWRDCCESCSASAERWVLMFVAASLTAHWDQTGLEPSSSLAQPGSGGGVTPSLNLTLIITSVHQSTSISSEVKTIKCFSHKYFLLAGSGKVWGFGRGERERERERERLSVTPLTPVFLQLPQSADQSQILEILQSVSSQKLFLLFTSLAICIQPLKTWLAEHSSDQNLLLIH